MSLGLTTALRGWLHRRVRRAWQRRGLLAILLLPLHFAHRAWRGVRALGYRLGLARPVKLPVPVVVVGNLTVGGTGKTPLVIEIVRALRARGWSPGIVSGGYGGRSQRPVLVDPASDAAQCGDEALLIRHVTGCPVAVGRDRIAAARLLLATHGACNVLIADDGLQHRRLGRDLEIVLLDATGVGNGLLLPAGPLRDPPARLRQVDAVVLHGIVPPVRIYSPFFRMHTSIIDATCLASPARQMTLAQMAHEQQAGELRLLAICAIGNPQRFFSQLREQGLRFDAIALPDHDRIEASMTAPGRYQRVLMTEKDAVKCHRDARLGHDERIWVVPLHTQLDASLFDFLAARLGKERDGSKTA
ncbi:lipid A 4'kinase [Burkholderiales bacterium]|nr:lipid A 4'kinase [Burkholderiales bacterium]